jgi:hypothetical protein
MKFMQSLPFKLGTVRLRLLCCSLIGVVLLSSCGGPRKLQSDIRNSRDKDRGTFVQTEDGTVLEGESLKVKYPFFKKAYVEINKSEKVKLRDVVVLQNEEGYYRKINGQLAPRIKKGGINTYLTTKTVTEYEAPSTSNGNMGRHRSRVVEIYYLQKTDSGVVKQMTPAVVNEFVSDYEPAKEFMDEYYRTQRKVRTWSWINTGAVVGGAVLMVTSGGDGGDDGQNDDLDAQAYVGFGLFMGGLINGVVNKFRKGRNYKNLELAIDEYNRGYNKKRR